MLFVKLLEGEMQLIRTKVGDSFVDVEVVVWFAIEVGDFESQ